MIDKKNAIIYTHNLLAENFAKTAHGLLRGTERYNIVAVIDKIHFGKDAGNVFHNKKLNIPVYETVESFLNDNTPTIDFCIVGVAFPGGQLPNECRDELFSAMRNKISIVSGLHQLLSEDKDFIKLSKKYSVDLIDIRKPRPTSELHFWSGEIFDIKTPIVAVLGTDCAVGKRTLARYLWKECKEKGIHSDLIFTGQTGWLQGYSHGFIFDATPNDFVSGEIERAIIDCNNDSNPDLIFLEGQSSLRNPSGPCGSEFILSGNAKNVFLVHPIEREFFIDLEEKECLLPNVEDEIKLIEAYGANVLGLGINYDGKSTNEFEKIKDQLSDNLSLPVLNPVQDGVSKFVDKIQKTLL